MTSKKRSGTSTRQPEPLTFFIDRSLGRGVGLTLRKAGALIELHDDHFKQDAPDEEWLAEAGAKNWAVFTKDKKIRYRPIERDALLAANLRVFVLAGSGNLTGEQMGQLILAHLRRIERLARKHEAPFTQPTRWPG